MVPERPKIYHITHYQNLHSIFKDGALHSDARCSRESAGNINIGITEIKRRRLEEIIVSCCPGKKVGEFVPFYFCPRSIMLFIIHKVNHPDMKYTDGQRGIVHLECDFYRTVEWAGQNRVEWAFSTSNAGARYSQFYNQAENLQFIDWSAVSSADFRNPLVKERKQAEFLFYDSFPLHLVDKFATITETMAENISDILKGTEHAPKIAVEPAWYF